jgi:hypothetical protein
VRALRFCLGVRQGDRLAVGGSVSLADSHNAEQRRYVIAPSVTSCATGSHITKPIAEPLVEFTASADYAELKRQVHNACQIEAVYLAKNGGEVSTWINDKCICSTTGCKRAIQHSIISEGEPCGIEETIQRAVAITSSCANETGLGEHRCHEQGGARTLDKGRVHHPGQQSIFTVTQ